MSPFLESVLSSCLYIIGHAIISWRSHTPPRPIHLKIWESAPKSMMSRLTITHSYISIFNKHVCVESMISSHDCPSSQNLYIHNPQIYIICGLRIYPICGRFSVCAMFKCYFPLLIYTQCLRKNCAKLFLSELRQTFINFNNFW